MCEGKAVEKVVFESNKSPKQWPNRELTSSAKMPLISVGPGFGPKVTGVKCKDYRPIL